VADLTAIDSDALGAWMREQRWFGAKAADLTHFGVLEVVELDDRLSIALAEARFNSGVHDLYQLLVSGEDLDALSDPSRATAILSSMVLAADVGPVHFHWTGALPTPSLAPEVHGMGAEQSNSTIVFDDALALKVFRRLLPGDNPELEMLRFLGAHGFENIAALAGWYELAGERMQATLGVLQRFVADGRDGWDFALSEPEEFLERARELGSVTGRLHSVLAGDATDPDFAPEEPGDEALGLLVATIDEEIERTFLDLREDDPVVAPILGRGQELRERLQLLSHQSAGGRLIRHHGDYHLGQTLIAPEGWIILDFEGEPARSLPERRRKRSPVRDVAGMLRSFAYAASARDLPEGWEATARERFLDGYLADVEPVLMPAGEVAVTKLLAIHELEKAIYELRYELNNRPDWVPIPVSGIVRLLDAPLH
jgi:predicted trehalose synthase